MCGRETDLVRRKRFASPFERLVESDQFERQIQVGKVGAIQRNRLSERALNGMMLVVEVVSLWRKVEKRIPIGSGFHGDQLRWVREIP